MNVQAVEQYLDRWIDAIRPDVSDEEFLKIYDRLCVEEFDEAQTAQTIGNQVKELTDFIVVLRPKIVHGSGYQMNFAHNMSQACKATLHNLGVNWWQALAKVTDSNFSKLILPHEIDSAMDYFIELGIEVEISPVIDEYFGAYSRFDQTVGDKEYQANKLLKGPNYHAIDESVEWWL